MDKEIRLHVSLFFSLCQSNLVASPSEDLGPLCHVLLQLLRYDEKTHEKKQCAAQLQASFHPMP